MTDIFDSSALSSSTYARTSYHINSETYSYFQSLRHILEILWCPETSSKGESGSSGQCAVTAMLIRELWPESEFRSTVINGESHWYVRVYGKDFEDGWEEVDLTGDQFPNGIKVAIRDSLYPDSRVRTWSDINDETRRRYNILKTRWNNLAKKIIHGGAKVNALS